MLDLQYPIPFLPNIRNEKKAATRGYIWGKPVPQSLILQMMGLVVQKSGQIRIEHDQINKLGITETDLIAERWIVSDDREYPSCVPMPDGRSIPFFEILKEKGEAILGKYHWEEKGPFLSTIMKLIDTHSDYQRGSLSAQVHPKKGYPLRPPKTEMWKGKGQIYIGWNKDMTEEKIREAVENGTLEKCMNSVQLDGNNLVLVSGGVIHAIRYGTFISEWSKAPDKEDLKKGHIKEATLSLYDRTDGKTPRPQKEDIKGVMDVLKHARTFNKTRNYLCHSREMINDGKGNTLSILFKTPDIIVEELRISKSFESSVEKRGLPIFVEKGVIEVRQGKKILDRLQQGEERFFPHSMKKFMLVSKGDTPALIQRWYAPLKNEDF
ncbi:MAG: hypothetical protein JW774_13080 [Candidatus Aureabacteria bacterium]|nr:hypothetical protein [Candidatus Auribacterota bacterium]